jgi:hypothetical protein
MLSKPTGACETPIRPKPSESTTDDMRAALKRRIVVYQALYALATLTCLLNTYLAIGLLVALQLNSVIAPRIGVLDRA